MIEVKAEGFAELSKALKVAGDKELKRELSKAMSAATKPFIAAVRQSARTTLPAHGGLNRKVAATPIRTVKKASGVQVRARSPYSIGMIDKGRVPHPVFGNRDVWVTQPVNPGFWSEPAKEQEAVVKAEATKAMDRVVAKLNRIP